MSYQVIARKWRPKNFDELVGQDHIADTLKNAIINDRVGHAFLFTGVRGVGKTTTARILAKRLNCENPDGGNPCNKCSSCIDVQAGRHIDVIEIDGASNTGVDDVKVLREAAKYLPSRGKYKIYIIDEVHMLSEKAFNALLKTLEEPPSHVKFIFATTDPHKIPITIKSRCQIYDFKAISLDEIFNQLKFILDHENIKYEESALYLVAKKAEGSMRDAQSLLEQVISFEADNITKSNVLTILGVTDSDILFEITDAIIENRIEKIIVLTDELISSGINLIHFYKELIEHFHALLVVSKVKNPYNILKMPDFEIKRYIKQASKFENNFIKLYQMLIDGFENLKSSRFQRISFEINLIKLAQYKPVTPLKDILKFVNKLANTFDSQPDARKIEIDLFGLVKSNNTLQHDKSGLNENNKYEITSKKDALSQENTPKNDNTEKTEIESINKSDLPSLVNYDFYKENFRKFFDTENESYSYFFNNVKIPIEYDNEILKLEYPASSEITFNLHVGFKEKYSDWIKKHFKGVKEVKFVLDNSDKETFEKITIREKIEKEKIRKEAIRNLDGVKKIKDTFNLIIDESK